MRYPGGKGGAGVYQQIIAQMPPHRVYIEPFLGGGAVMRQKRAAARTIGIDRDAAAVAGVRAVLDGLPGLDLRVGDALTFLREYPWTGDEMVYADPPYLLDTRGGRSYYTYEMGTPDEHRALLGLLTVLPCHVAISGYPSVLYDELLIGWRVHTFGAMTRGGPRTESLWCNYAAPAALHDYRYAGANYRERERIKRKGARWRTRLAGLDAIERGALIAAVLDDSVLLSDLLRALDDR